MIPPVVMLYKLHAAAKYKTFFSQRKPIINQRRYLLGGTKSSFSGSLPWKKTKISQTFPFLLHTSRSRSAKDIFYISAPGKIKAEVIKALNKHQNRAKKTKNENESQKFTSAIGIFKRSWMGKSVFTTTRGIKTNRLLLLSTAEKSAHEQAAFLPIMGLVQNMENTAKAEAQEVKDNKKHQDEIIYCHRCQEAFMAVRKGHRKSSVPLLKTAPNSLCADSSVSCRSCPTPVSDARHCLHPSSHCPLHHTWIRQESKKNKSFVAAALTGGQVWEATPVMHPTSFLNMSSLGVSLSFPNLDSKWVSSKNSHNLKSHKLGGRTKSVWLVPWGWRAPFQKLCQILPGESGVTASCHVPHLSLPPALGAEMAERAQHPFLSLIFSLLL